MILLQNVRQDARELRNGEGAEGDRFDEWQLIGERLECPVISPVAFHFNQFAWPKLKPVISTRP